MLSRTIATASPLALRSSRKSTKLAFTIIPSPQAFDVLVAVEAHSLCRLLVRPSFPESRCVVACGMPREHARRSLVFICAYANPGLTDCFRSRQHFREFGRSTRWRRIGQLE